MTKKNYILVGASGGIGFSILKQLVSKKNYVLIFARNLNLIEESFSNCEYINCVQVDLNKPNDLETILKELTIKVKFDGLIYAAGVEGTTPLRLSTYNKIIEFYNINSICAHLFVNFFSRNLVSNDSSSVVIISSIMSEIGASGKSIYCGSKSSINGLIKSSALELSKRKIRVNSISPGIVLTKMGENLLNKLSKLDQENMKNEYPLGFGKPNDISNLTLYLLSKKSKWITGQNFIIDGGYSIK